MPDIKSPELILSTTLKPRANAEKQEKVRRLRAIRFANAEELVTQAIPASAEDEAAREADEVGLEMAEQAAAEEAPFVNAEGKAIEEAVAQQ